MFALILLTNYCCSYRHNYGRHCYYQSSVEHKIAASSPSGHSALTNQLHEMRICRKNKIFRKIAKVHSVSLLLVSNFIITSVL